jgi:NAD(P)H-dependent FMN reductase
LKESVMLRIAIVTGARPGRLAETVARWIVDLACRRADAQVSLVDIAAHGMAVQGGRCTPERLRAWSRTVAAFDGFVFVTPEYHERSAASLRAAIHAVARDWRNKPAGFVGYGALGAARAVMDLRQALSAVGVAPVTPRVALTLVQDVWNRSSFVPDPLDAHEVHGLLAQLIGCAGDLKTVRIAIGQQREPVPSPGFRADDRRFGAQ